MTIYGDKRWQGSHGIGRFATQIFRLCPEIEPLDPGGRPTEALDGLRLARVLSSLPPKSVFFSPGFNPPLASAHSFVFTMHDLNHIDRGENSSWGKRLCYRLVLRRACRQAAAVLTVSEFSRRRIVDWAGVEAEKVVNVSNGVARTFQPGPPQACREQDGYLLCVGNRKGHKNERRVVEAFARAGLPASVRLRFTGEASAELLELAQRGGVGGRVEFTGRVEERLMPALYREARALVFPSLYEGFGLPVLESMACGTPVITSTTTALPEVAGEAALLVDPESVEAIAAAICRLMQDEALGARLRERGLARAAQFTWERTAGLVWQVLEQATQRLARTEAIGNQNAFLSIRSRKCVRLNKRRRATGGIWQGSRL